MTREERKKAIDALKISAPIKAMTQEEFNDYIQTLNEVMDWLEQEPCDDAKPETVTEFADRCRKCGAKYGKLLKQEPKWIPVRERLPEDGRTVIASTKYGVYGEARYTKEYGWEWAYEAGADYWSELEGVEAWMPLPEPYESQESEG